MEVFPFFVGCGRSGTTLFRAIFDSHPDLAIPGESHFIVHLAPNGRRYESGARFDVEAFLADLLPHPRFRLWGLGDHQVRLALQERPPRTLPDAIRTVFATYATAEGKARYGDKTPGYVSHLSRLASLFPEARFVHIVRDGRDVALSYLDVSFGPATAEGAALHWRRLVERGRRAGAPLGADRYVEVRYEDLLDDPEATIRSLCDFIHLEFHPLMLRYPERAAEVARGSAFPEAHGRLALPPTKGLRDWRTQMTVKDVTSFELLAGDLLTDLGYELAGERPGVGARARTRARRLQIEARRLAHGVGKRAGITVNRRGS
ncbi:MAG: sulfotransferase family protein [Actinomycetota bacterium]